MQTARTRSKQQIVVWSDSSENAAVRVHFSDLSFNLLDIHRYVCFCACILYVQYYYLSFKWIISPQPSFCISDLKKTSFICVIICIIIKLWCSLTHCWSPCSRTVRSSPLRWAGLLPSGSVSPTWWQLSRLPALPRIHIQSPLTDNEGSSHIDGHIFERCN